MLGPQPFRLLTCSLVSMALLACSGRAFDRQQGAPTKLLPVHHWSAGSEGQGPGQFYKPDAIAVTADGIIVAGDTNNGRVHLLDSDGTFLRSIAHQDMGEVQGIAVDDRHRLYVVDRNGSSVFRFDLKTGDAIDKIGIFGTEQGKLMSPQGVAVDRQRRAFVTDSGRSRIVVFDEQGEFLFEFGEEGTGPGQLLDIEAIYISNAEEIFIADEANHRIQVWSIEGDYLRTLGGKGDGPGQFPGDPEGITGDSVGRIYVMDEDLGRIHIFDPNSGAVVGMIDGGVGRLPGQTNSADGIAVDPVRNALYVADQGNFRVQRWELPQLED